MSALACDPDGSCAGSDGDGKPVVFFVYGNLDAKVPVTIEATWEATSPSTEQLEFSVFLRTEDGFEEVGEILASSPLRYEITVEPRLEYQVTVRPTGLARVAISQDVAIVVSGPLRAEN